MEDYKKQVKFLADNGFNAILDKDGYIEDIVNISTGEKLQNGGYRGFFSADKSISIWFDASGITIEKDGLMLELMNHHRINIKDTETKQYISLIYRSGRLHLEDLASLDLEMGNEFANEDGLAIVQGAFGAKVFRGNVDNQKTTQLEDGNVQMYLQTIIDCIKETKYIVSNPKIASKLGLVVTFAQDSVNKIVNVKYERQDAILYLLEKKKIQLKQQMEQINSELEQCDIAITQIKSTGKVTKQ